MAEQHERVETRPRRLGRIDTIAGLGLVLGLMAIAKVDWDAELPWLIALGGLWWSVRVVGRVASRWSQGFVEAFSESARGGATAALGYAVFLALLVIAHRTGGQVPSVRDNAETLAVASIVVLGIWFVLTRQDRRRRWTIAAAVSAIALLAIGTQIAGQPSPWNVVSSLTMATGIILVLAAIFGYLRARQPVWVVESVDLTLGPPRRDRP